MLIAPLIIVLLIIVLILLIVWNVMNTSTPQANFESMFIQKAQNPLFLNELLVNPKGVLESEISEFIETPYSLPPTTNVKVIVEQPNDLYLLIPSQTALPSNGTIDSIVDTLNETQSYGLFLGNYKGSWWRFGIHEGSCIADIENELASVRARKGPLVC